MAEYVLSKWNSADYAKAMANAISQHADAKFLSKNGDKFKFNGFWRNGDKQNVCAWIDRGTWHDAKTGDGGGCKEFAQVAFGLNMKEFMERYGPGLYLPKFNEHLHQVSANKHENKNNDIKLSLQYVDALWQQLQKHESNKKDNATLWLKESRGIPEPKTCISSGYANLSALDVMLFDTHHKEFIKNRLDKGQIIVAPLRSIHDNTVKNLFFRLFSEADKSEKSRLLPDCGGWGNLKEGLRAFGYPHVIKDFPHIILCEGMADYFAAEYLLDASEKYLPLGAANADALLKWAQWFAEIQFNGCIHVIYQLDTNNQGQVSATEIGPQKALQAAQILLNAGIKAKPFNWFSYLTHTTKNPSHINDLADSLRNEHINHESSYEHLQCMFHCCLEGNL